MMSGLRRPWLALVVFASVLLMLGCSEETAAVPSGANSFPVQKFEFAQCDLAHVDSSCTVKVGETVSLGIRAAKSDLPSDFSVPIARLVVIKSGTEVMLQSCNLVVKSTDSDFELDGKMTIPMPPCKAVLRISERGKILLQRSVLIMEKS